ncbi:hydantoinase B/oxoprolinase family protein [Candidatus Spongiihabitans sp.]|uniref:hydantoinase B/oxoprolinase family protein n=1 Tax=Candidatus Spongiihabitans sp. TaxID=3101308 RepID=UPI003C7B8E8D
MSKTTHKRNTDKWEFWIDRGGTFTDVVARRPNGEVITHKLLSENPEQYRDAAIQGIKDILRLNSDLNNNQTLPAETIAAVKMGTTIATNALLERQGEPTLLATTKGFKDQLRIGYQTRPDLFALHVRLPQMLYGEVLEIDERIGAHGEIMLPLDEAAARRGLQNHFDNGLRGVAIVLMHGYRYHQHEARLQRLAQQIGFTQISVSHQVSPLMKLVSRGDTTVVDAYLSPILRRYVNQVAAELSGLGEHGGKLMFMRSNGGLTDAKFFQGKDAILSGPAGGVVGMARVSEAAGFNRVIGFDMGGTSTDVSHYNGEFEKAFETQVAGVRLRAPMMLIHTVAAGGGSILHFDGARFRVGPDSAGANPGPCCYRNGGPLTITDCNVMLGKLQPELFPKVFGENADQALDKDTVLTRFSALAEQIERAIGDRRKPQAVAAGFLAIAVENMANAIKKISVQRGYDVSEYTLCCFGGAGGQHACLVADALAMKRIIVHPLAGVLSAYGMGLADTVVDRQQAVEAVLTEATLAELTKKLDALQREGVDELRRQGDAATDGDGTTPRKGEVELSLEQKSRATHDAKAEDVTRDTTDAVGTGRDLSLHSHDAKAEDGAELSFKRLLHVRYQGSDTALIVAHGRLDEVITRFEQVHQMRFGFITKDKAMIVESIQVETISAAKSSRIAPTHDAKADAVGTGRDLSLLSGDTKAEAVVKNAHAKAAGAPTPDAVHRCYMEDEWRDTPFFHRASLRAEHEIDGPAVVLDPTATIVVEPGWCATLTEDNNLVLERYQQRKEVKAIGAEVDPVMLEIFNNLFMSIAEQMGSVLENTAASVNIKERLDFSCAIFDPCGALVANAPHMPVHLGSMGESIKTVIRERGGDISPGDAYILNAPYNGGTHLPDVTIIKPVFVAGKLLFYVASRGHHADIGGKTPGSAPADSTSIEEEGVVIDNFKLVENGRFREREIDALLRGGKWPARNPQMNIADFKAQLAACEKGARELLALTAHYGVATVHAYMKHVQDNAEESVRRVLGVLDDGEFTYKMDDGCQIAVSIKVDRQNRKAIIDFTGTSAQHPGNFNAPEAVVRAAVLYVFRCLVADNIPLNEGCLKPMKIIIPPRSMISPQYPAAVIAGNVETSQYLVDTLFGAVQAVAASQGTMNNFIWGNDEHQYYETICGGTGATPDAPGTDAVHSHMTNSRLTDPEVLEWRFPVILESFAIRKHSGGQGKHRGGDGVIRKVKFLEPMTANIISGHRKVPPYGLNGGGAGQTGRNYVEHADGTVTRLSATDQIELKEGDVVVIETPGGGGCN